MPTATKNPVTVPPSATAKPRKPRAARKARSARKPLAPRPSKWTAPDQREGYCD
ncbi:MAG: hypothetical protein WDM76_09485 [Limisphaerales bacterium]